MPGDVPWEETLGCSWEELFQGTLALVHQGCAYYALLVVAGEYHGRVVYVNLDCCEAPYFVHHPDFLSWYERWLDELLWGYETSWFGFGLPGREEDLVAVLNQPGTPTDLRTEALSTLSRVPSLRPESVDVVGVALGDSSARVRQLAVALLGKHQVGQAEAGVRALLTDPDPAVRKGAVEALAKLPGSDWQPAARAALQDERHEVIFRALCLLKGAGALHRSDLEPLLRSESPEARSSALWAAGSLPKEAGPVEVSDDLLHDPDPYVRRMAITRTAELRDRRRAPALITMLQAETDPELACFLIRALGDLGDRAAVPVLIKMTRHPDGFVRQDAAQALGKLGDRRAGITLRGLLSDRSTPARKDERGFTTMMSGKTVADAAREALYRIGEW